MPIVRKLIKLNTSRAVCIPKSWLEFFEKQQGAKVTEVTIEVNGALTVRPVLTAAHATA